jgi:hypothetical protein
MAFTHFANDFRDTILEILWILKILDKRAIRRLLGIICIRKAPISQGKPLLRTFAEAADGAAKPGE